MKVLIFVLNKVEKLDELLIELSNNGLKGATILKSVGMAKSIYNSTKKEESRNIIMDSLKILLSETDNENRTIFTVVDESQEKIFYNTVEEVIGPVSKENTGIIFTIPLSSVYGLNSN